VLKQAKGNFGGRRKLYRTAKETLLRAGAFAYRDRRQKKRLPAGSGSSASTRHAASSGSPYSVFMNSLKKAGILLRPQDSRRAGHDDPGAFAKLAEKAKS